MDKSLTRFSPKENYFVFLQNIDCKRFQSATHHPVRYSLVNIRVAPIFVHSGQNERI
jgi:hypothetical protein